MNCAAFITSNRLRVARIAVPLAALGVLHSVTLARNHNEAEDAGYYMVNVTNNYDLFNPNHLLFSAVNRVNYDVWTALGYEPDAVVPMQAFSALTGLISLFLIYRIAGRLGVSVPFAIAVMGWTAFTFGFWVYSLEGDTYLLPIPFVLLSVLLLFRIGTGTTTERLRLLVAQSTSLGLCTAIAVLLHQQYISLVPIMVIAVFSVLWRSVNSGRQTLIIVGISTYSITSLGVVAAGYLAVGFFHNGFHTVSETISWSRGLANHGLWDALSPHTPMAAVAGITRSVFSVNFLFHFDASSTVVSAAFPGKDLVEEYYLAHHGISTVGCILVAAATIAAVGAIGWLMVAIVRNPGEDQDFEANRPRWIFVRFAIVYLLITAAMIIVWEPANPEFWIACLPVLALVLATLAHTRPHALRPAVLLAISLFIANFLGAVLPYSSPDSDVWSQRNAIYAEVARTGDLVVTADCPYVCLGNLGLITEVRPLDVASDYGAPTLAARLASPTDGRVLISASAVRSIAQSEGGSRSMIQRILTDVDYRLVPLGGTGEHTVYLVARPR